MYRTKHVQNKICENRYRRISDIIHNEKVTKMRPFVDDFHKNPLPKRSF